MRKNHHSNSPFAISDHRQLRAERSTPRSIQADSHLRKRSTSFQEQMISMDMDKQALLNAIPDLLFRISSDGFYLQCQAAADYDLLVPPDRFLGKSVYDAMPVQVAHHFMDAVTTTLLTGQIQTLEYPLSIHGTVRYYEARIASSGPDEVLAMIRNISDRKAAEEALRASEDRFRTLLNSSPDMIYLFDAASNQIVFANRSEFCGYDQSLFFAAQCTLMVALQNSVKGAGFGR